MDRIIKIKNTYIFKNDSYSEKTYVVNGVEYTLRSKEEVQFDKLPELYLKITESICDYYVDIDGEKLSKEDYFRKYNLNIRDTEEECIKHLDGITSVIKNYLNEILAKNSNKPINVAMVLDDLRELLKYESDKSYKKLIIEWLVSKLDSLEVK